MISSDRIMTNQLLIEEIDLWNQVIIKKNDTDEIKEYYNLLSKIINRFLEESIDWLSSEDAQNFFFKQTKYQQKLFEDLEEHLDEILDKDYISIDALLDDVYKKGKEIGYDDIDEKIRFTEADRLALQIAKDYNYMLINNLSDDLRHQLRYEMFKGLIAGEHPYEMANRLVNIGVQPLKGSTLSPRQRAIMITRTECSRMQNTGILQSYVNEGYKDVKLLTAGDSNVCTICLKYAFEFNDDSEITYENRGEEKIHPIEDIIGLIPFHPLCRCTVLSVWKTKGEPPKKPFVTNLTEPENGVTLIEGDDGRFYPIVGDTHRGRIEFERKYGITADDLTPEEVEFIRMYTKYGDSIINYELRGLKDNPDIPKRNPKREWNKLAKERGIEIDFDRALELAKQIFDKGKPLKEPVVLVRRERKRYMNQDKYGYYSDSGIVSTAIGKDIKSDVYGDVVNYILVSEETNILYVEGVTATPKDFEVILPPNSRLTHLRDENDNVKIWKLD